jgi:hypothetical protein
LRPPGSHNSAVCWLGDTEQVNFQSLSFQISKIIVTIISTSKVAKKDKWLHEHHILNAVPEDLSVH